MASILKSLRVLADPNRLRLLLLLEREELSVNELQEITRMGQSRPPVNGEDKRRVRCNPRKRVTV